MTDRGPSLPSYLPDKRPIYVSGAVRPLFQGIERKDAILPLRAAILERLAALKINVLCAHAYTLENIPPLEEGETIYSRDMGWIMASCGVIADLRVESFGVGMELERARTTGKPTLMLLPLGGYISGMLEDWDSAELCMYGTSDGTTPTEEGLEQVLGCVGAFVVPPRNGCASYILKQSVRMKRNPRYRLLLLSEFKALCDAAAFSDGPYKDSLGDSSGDPWNPRSNRQVFGMLKEGEVAYACLSEETS